MGAFVGSMFALTLGDKLGRVRCITFGVICNTAGAILQISSWKFPQFIVGRVLNGYGMGTLEVLHCGQSSWLADTNSHVCCTLGLTSSVTPVYQAECSNSRSRGKLVVIQSASNTAAFCLSNWINYGLYFTPGPMQWRFPLGFQLVFALIVFVTLLFVPESPRWLLLRDRHEEALEVIARLSGKNCGVHDETVVAQFLSIKTAIVEERQDRVPVKDLVLCRDKQQNFRRLLLACGTQFMQQFSGINALGK